MRAGVDGSMPCSCPRPTTHSIAITTPRMKRGSSGRWRTSSPGAARRSAISGPVSCGSLTPSRARTSATSTSCGPCGAFSTARPRVVGRRGGPASNTPLPDLPVVLREVALDRRKVEGAQDRGRRLAPQEEVDAAPDEILDVLQLVAAPPPGKLRRGHLHRVPGVLAGVVDADLADPASGVGLGLHSHHGDPILSLNVMKHQAAAR